MLYEKNNKGITLIALVVSIIVLIILAGISINMLTGQTGILNRAQEAKEKTSTSQDLEYLYSTNKNPSKEQILTEDSSTLTEKQLSQKLIPVSKRNNQSWNFITQENAEKVAKTMYYNNLTVKSSLVDSYAWDTVVEWMTTKIDITDAEINSNDAIRGGSFNDNGSDFPVSYRHSNLDRKLNYNAHIGFRVVLYIQ